MYFIVDTIFFADNTKIDHKEIGCKVWTQNHLAQEKDQ
jgi:hypothetical protein